MLEFKKYNSIENTYNKEFMDRIKMEGYDSLQFVVQEKVHGANCCFVTDGETVQFAKRTGWVEAGEMFYSYEELVERYREKTIQLFHQVKKDYAEMTSLSIFGEMFGGRYPHPDVLNDKKVMCILQGKQVFQNYIAEPFLSTLLNQQFALQKSPTMLISPNALIL
jgi:RNA ligase.